MQPDHYNPVLGRLSEAQSKPSPYRLAARWDKRMEMIRVSVSGDRIQGFLMQARVKINGPAIGSFVNIIENPDATYQNCSLFTQDSGQNTYQATQTCFWDLYYYNDGPNRIGVSELISYFCLL
ncbi:Hypothetical predicted protein [Paramuricea clavata]|uniref:Reelin domain-containing protein n=1 Tax=Paramuricea clavata TaxID=317549 RepID=A0A7D9ECF3_PARCT|nr:Hypothetical predicted protein [Paramuricea clavata]